MNSKPYMAKFLVLIMFINKFKLVAGSGIEPLTSGL